MGRQGWVAETNGTTRVWVRELMPSNWQKKDESPPPGTSDSWAVLLENINTIFWKQRITFDPNRHLPPPHPDGDEDGWHSFTVRDLILRQDLGDFHNDFSALVDESSVAMFKVVRVPSTTSRSTL